MYVTRKIDKPIALFIKEVKHLPELGRLFNGADVWM